MNNIEDSLDKLYKFKINGMSIPIKTPEIIESKKITFEL